MTANGNSNSSTNKDNVPIKLHYPSYQSAAGNPRTNLVQGTTMELTSNVHPRIDRPHHRPESFCIRWRGFHANVSQTLLTLSDVANSNSPYSNAFADVTLVAAGESSFSTSAHRLVLAACSPLLARLLPGGSHGDPYQESVNPTLVLVGVSPQTLRALLAYMYHGEVLLTEDKLAEFFKTASALEIKGIADASPPQHPVLPSVSGPDQQQMITPLPFGSHTSEKTSNGLSANDPHEQQQQHPVGDLTLLAAAATIQNNTNVLGEVPGSISKRRKAMPRRLDVTSFKLMPRDGGCGDLTPPTSAASAANDENAIPIQQHNGLVAMNLSTKPTNNKQQNDSNFVARAGLLTIPNPSNFASILRESERREKQVEGEKQRTRERKISIASSSGSMMDYLPTSPVDMSAAAAVTSVQPTIRSDITPPCTLGSISPTSPASVPITSATTDNNSDCFLLTNSASAVVSTSPQSPPVTPIFKPGSSGTQTQNPDPVKSVAPGDLTKRSGEDLAPVSNTTTPEQMAALLGPSWKSRQPRLCQYCQRMFSNKFNLKQHILNMHTVGRELHCEICQKKVKNKWYLRRHHVTHHGAPLKK